MDPYGNNAFVAMPLLPAYEVVGQQLNKILFFLIIQLNKCQVSSL